MNNKVAGTAKEVSGVGLKSTQAATAGTQRVPLGPGKANPNIATQTSTTQRPPLNPIQKSNTESESFERVSVPVEGILGRDDEMDHMEIEIGVPPKGLLRDVISIEVEDTPQVPDSSQSEVESLVEIRPEEESEESEDDFEEPEEKLVRQWPELATVRAERYRKEVNSIRERFHEEPEEDMNMCSEYADEIFQYMGDLEVWQLVRLNVPALVN